MIAKETRLTKLSATPVDNKRIESPVTPSLAHERRCARANDSSAFGWSRAGWYL